MNKRIFIVLIVALTNLLLSCDPDHNIDFVNKSNYEAKIKINLNSNNENYDLKQNAIGDSIVFYLKKDSIANIDFGIGLWDKKEINEIVRTIKNIEIETKDVKTIYKTEKSMNEILYNNVKGVFMKTNIQIEIK